MDPLRREACTGHIGSHVLERAIVETVRALFVDKRLPAVVVALHSLSLGQLGTQAVPLALFDL